MDSSTVIETSTVLYALGLTLFAGLSTGLGSLLAFFTKGNSPRFLSTSLGFSAGVMIYVSFVEIFPGALEQLIPALGKGMGSCVAVASFFGGIFVIGLIDKLVPEEENPHETIYEGVLEKGIEEQRAAEAKKLHRLGIFTALAIAIHNFPEGLATFAATLANPDTGLIIAIAIAIHNIPEGIAVSVPIYYATGSKKKAFIHSFLSGLAEPFGALVGYLILMNFLSPVVFGVLFGLIAGIMVFISLDKLLPTAEQYGEHHLCMYGMVLGMAVMAVSLLALTN